VALLLSYAACHHQHKRHLKAAHTVWISQRSLLQTPAQSPSDPANKAMATLTWQPESLQLSYPHSFRARWEAVNVL
jgi:hypothetical protein